MFQRENQSSNIQSHYAPSKGAPNFMDFVWKTHHHWAKMPHYDNILPSLTLTAPPALTY
jgi:hypothetical protein